MTSYLAQAYYCYKGLFTWLSWPAYISNVFLRPVLFVVMFAILGRFTRSSAEAQEYMVGMAAYSIVSIILAGVTQSFFYDRAFGTLPFLFGSAVNRTTNFFSRGALHLPNGLMSVATSLLVAWLLLDLDMSPDWLAMSSSILLIGVASTGFALFVSMFAVMFRNWNNSLGISLGLTLVLTGVVIPRDELPGILSESGHALPLTHGLAALRESIQGANVRSVEDDLLMELAVGLSYAAIGALIFRLIEAQSKRNGTLWLTG